MNKILLFSIVLITFVLFFSFNHNIVDLYAYSQSVYVDENDLLKPAPKIISFKQIDEKSIKVIWELDKHPEGKELKFFNIEITIGLDVDCCAPGTNKETFEEANSEPIPVEVREFVISNHKGNPLQNDTEYCVEVEAQWSGPNLDSQPKCLIFNENLNNEIYFLPIILILIILISSIFILKTLKTKN